MYSTEKGRSTYEKAEHRHCRAGYACPRLRCIRLSGEREHERIPNARCESYAHSDSYRFTHLHAISDARTNSTSNTRSHCDAHACTYSHSSPHGYPDSQSHTTPNSESTTASSPVRNPVHSNTDNRH